MERTDVRKLVDELTPADQQAPSLSIKQNDAKLALKNIQHAAEVRGLDLGYEFRAVQAYIAELEAKQAPPPTTPLERLEIEARELATRTSDLRAFLTSIEDGSCRVKLDPMAIRLLHRQRELMLQLYDTLITRIFLWGDVAPSSEAQADARSSASVLRRLSAQRNALSPM